MLAAAKPTLVFTPGTWHNSGAFDIVRSRLCAKGYSTTAIDLPSVGAEPPIVSLDTDAATLRSTLQTLADKGEEIVLVVHSYGGIANGKKGGVIMFMYLTAFVAPRGTSLLDMLGGEYPSWFNISGEYVYAMAPETIFYADVDPKLQAEAISELSWESKRVFSDPATYEPWNDNIDTAYVFCQQD
ncbi:hypothetical protein GQ44DRAFT_133801 [Phaeosphaeriaceae sp. PMI808]|nr:hypothetical protein GQ44DRAFT_133801 [Phaeosphaeriaceae sp. PMI808]